uniref:laminin subunit alpha-5-like isoform X2 n=1 Tax=Styela clava TaxID=7725 RepID=UPI0019394D6A|nr:laminin subunit alpha-5-like isoform X2 [Styela clava]
MLWLSVLLLVAANWDKTEGQLRVPKEPNVLTPPYFNIATGKEIESTATCGENGEQMFCKLTGGPNEFLYNENLRQGQFCDMCDANDTTKSHPIKYAIDGTEKWWQSPPLSQGNEFNKINITLHLGQVFHVAYAIIKFANSPRAGTWVLERSSDHGKTFQPWQYFANSNSDCYNLFGIDAFEEITSDDTVICTSEYSDVVPLERGEVIVSMVNRRPGARNFSHSPVLQEWSKATDVRLRLLRTKTLLGHLMAVQRQDPTVTRRYFYSIKDISIGGRCVCHGHADTCLSDPANKYKLKCECRHNTCGNSCEYCCSGYFQREWKAAVPESSNQCEACNCHGHSYQCYYDEQVAIRRQSLDMNGNYEGGGVCQNCSHFTAGINCEQCMDGYYRPADVDLRDPNGCRSCECDSAFTVGTCESETGRCYCQQQYEGDRCDRCATGYHLFPECPPCPCFYNGTRDNVCLPVHDACPCKYNYAGMYCDECAAGFYNFPDCILCACTGEGATSTHCDQYTGQCDCEEGFGGLDCDQCAPGYYDYPFCQSCACLTTFTTEQICNPKTGECLCTELVTGDSCNQCILGYFDFPQCKECECSSTGSTSNLCDAEIGRCDCLPNYQGLKCDECVPEFYNYPNCIPCNCDLRGSRRTTCDQQTGECTCTSFVVGTRCDQCAPEYFNFPECEDCKCDRRGIKAFISGECLAFTIGQCDCKENVIGKYCDQCAPLHYDLNSGCVDCNCLLQGTLDGVAACNFADGDCWCKTYTNSQRCSLCDSGFFGLEEKHYFGCSGCQCDPGGAVDENCDSVDGQCRCKLGVSGRQCDSVLPGYYYPTLLHHKYEVEYGFTLDDSILRFGFNETQFPGYSMKGYGEFSDIQPEINVPVIVENSGLYRILIYYVQPGDSSVANITISPLTSVGSSQTFETVFDSRPIPTMMIMKDVFVLNRGQWNVIIQGDSGLLIDYFILLPSEYYEPGILQAKITEPCKPTPESTGKECIMYSHPNLDSGTHAVLVDFVDEERHAQPSVSHPLMVILDGNSLIEGNRKASATLSPESAGEYVLVVEYASLVDEMQTIEMQVTDGAGHAYNDTKFNVYSCGYSFLCRQVALTSNNDVAVFDVSVSNMEIEMGIDAGEVVYVHGIHAIPHNEWSLEYVQPKRRCIAKDGNHFDECIAWSYPLPETGRKFEAGARNTSDIKAPSATDENIDTMFISGNMSIQIEMNLDPGRYVYILHYYNPHQLSFQPSVVISGGITHEGTANVTFCPDGDGCRAVVVSDTGAALLDIMNPTQTMTIQVPKDNEQHGKSFWLDYVLAIPEDSYRTEILDLMKIDNTRKFFEECYKVGAKGLIELTNTPSEFCRSAVFSLTMEFNDGALYCDCSKEGTIDGNANCSEYGGQCPCKPGVIGNRCESCNIGYYGYPDCKPCNCTGQLCDELNGNCICPPNTAMPSCDRCLPFTHSFHPLAGCLACDCNRKGVEDAKDLGCSEENGQCRCKENVEGHMCDKCKPGFFAFPDCVPCECDPRGSVSQVCNHVNGQCLCKDNVEGQQCDRCKSGTFHMDFANPLGCTKCFCFGASDECSGTLYPETEIIEMNGWTLLHLKTDFPEVLVEGQTATVDIEANGGIKDSTRPSLYWFAPVQYLGDKVGSYGGILHYVTESRRGGRGDAGSSSYVPSPADNPAPLLAGPPSVVLEGNGMLIRLIKQEYEGKVSVLLTENNFVHQSTGNQVTREEMMMVLSPLSSLRIHATDDLQAVSVSISDVSMTTTDYKALLNSAPTILTVEECQCPPGYIGESCQLCARGHYREARGPYLGYCAECDCFGHCDKCDDKGGLIDREDCLHNTIGDKCEQCRDGYYGNPMSRHPDACRICPCPYPTETGNFAKTCEFDEDGLVCNCEPGYTGDRCEYCSTGYFGNPHVIGGKCQTCNCHNNLDIGDDMETCNTETGGCSDCKFNTGGKYCERCADGYYGDAVEARNCTKCPCNECGALQCDHVYGDCDCKKHVIGWHCELCEEGYYNLNSCVGCQLCHCEIGAKTSACDIATGQCECAPNVVGLKCEKCEHGHWDYSEIGCKSCNCFNDGECNPITGECKCPPGVMGPYCDQCKLERYVLPRGQEECEPCDECTHFLLDLVEPMTQELISATRQLANVSVGHIALNKLDKYGKKSMAFRTNMDEQDDYMDALNDDIDRLLKTENLGESYSMDEVSGSGESVKQFLVYSTKEGSGAIEPIPLDDMDGEDSYVTIQQHLENIEIRVGDMCNRTEGLLEDIEKTGSRTIMLDANTKAASDDVTEFENSAKDTLNYLVEESSGDEPVDDDRKLYEVQMMLQRMKERDFTLKKNSATIELKEAEELFNLVDQQFVLPSTEVQERVGNLSQDLSSKLYKLKELKHRLVVTNKTVVQITALNNENRKNLANGRESIYRISVIWEEINQYMNDSAFAIDNDGGKLPDAENNDVLLDLIEQLQPVYDERLENLDGMAELVNKSIDKANMLDDDAEMLIKVVNETKNDPRNLRAVEAANRYQTIFNILKQAEEAANNADLDATEARDEVAEKNLGKIAANADGNSSQLLKEVQNLLNKESDLQNDLNDAKTRLTSVDASVMNIQFRLEITKEGATTLERDDIDGMVQDIKDQAANANQITNETIEMVNELQELIDQAPDTNMSINDELTIVQNILETIPDAVESFDLETARLRRKAARISQLPQDFDLDDRMNRIRKLIELSRSRAGNVKLSMKFKKNDGLDKPEYAQVRIPPQVASADNYLKIDLFVNTSRTADSSILYMGDVSSSTGDYISLESIDGRVHYNYKVGEGEGQLVSSVTINDNEWHRIVLHRIGNKGRLQVHYIEPGDIFSGGGSTNETIEGITNSDDVRAYMPRETTPLIIGGTPINSDTLPEVIQNKEMDGCVQSVKINDERIGIWNFMSYNGPQPGQICVDGPADVPPTSEAGRMWKFRGVDSYLRVHSEQLQGQRFYVTSTSTSFIFRFKFRTVQSNSLLFFIGQSVSQFFALELRNGKFVLTCNFGWDEPKSETVTSFPDVNTHPQALSIKAGVVSITKQLKMIVLAINSGLNLNITFTDWAPDIRGDAWVGGIHRYDIKDEFRPYVKMLDEHFRGCLGGLAFHLRASFSIYEAYERVGVTRGCMPETISTVEVNGNDYINIASGLSNVDRIAGIATARTIKPEGTILSANEQEVGGEQIKLFMRDGHMVLSDGDTEVLSKDTYNDGEPHTIRFERYTGGTLYLNVDNLDVQTSEEKESEDAKRRRKRRLRRKRPKTSSTKTSIFAESRVHIYVGGSRDDPKFDGCIGNIQIERDPKHHGLLTEKARCGYYGSAMCTGKPKFNQCMIPSKSGTKTLAITDSINSKPKPKMMGGEVSAHEFTNAGTSLNGDEINGSNATIAASLESGDNKKRNGKRRGGRNKKKSGNRSQELVLGIDAVQLFDPGYDGDCQLPLDPKTSGFYYPGDGYSKYSVDNFDSFNWRFSLKIRTEQREGIIFFMCTTGCPEHIAVYLIKGRVTLSVKFGIERRRIKSIYKFNDGYWHDITFQRKAQNLQMIIDDTITNIELYETSYTFSTLMLFYVGGMQEMEKADAATFMSPMHLSDFNGCIQNLVVNDQPIENSKLSRLLFKINLRPCFEGDTEPGMFFSNSNPSEVGTYLLVYNVYNVGTNLEVTMEIRPRAQSGVLLAAGGQTGNFFQLVLIDGKVVARLKQETNMLMSVYDPSDYRDSICDGNWHKVQVIKAKNILTLSVDGNQVLPIEQGDIAIRSCETDGPLYIGGLPRNANVGRLLSDKRQYIGCMRKVRVDYFSITPSIAIEVKSGVSENSCPY